MDLQTIANKTKLVDPPADIMNSFLPNRLFRLVLPLTFWYPNYFLLILAHAVYKM